MTEPITPDAATLVGVLRVLTQAATDAQAHVDAAADLEVQAHADTTALVQDLIAQLRDLDRDLSVSLGKREGAIQGNLTDGRQFTLKRTQDRKAWDHEEWKRDARRAITKAITGRYEVPTVVDMETGEELSLGHVVQQAMTMIQNVHGSANPKSTALKPLGLYASDYCESTPGGWKLTAIRAEPKTEATTTEKDA